MTTADWIVLLSVCVLGAALWWRANLLVAATGAAVTLRGLTGGRSRKFWVSILIATVGVALALSAASIGTWGFRNWIVPLVLSGTAMLIGRVYQAELGVQGHKALNTAAIGVLVLLVLAIPAWTKQNEVHPPRRVDCPKVSAREKRVCVLNQAGSEYTGTEYGTPSGYAVCYSKGEQVARDRKVVGDVALFRFFPKPGMDTESILIAYQAVPKGPGGADPCPTWED